MREPTTLRRGEARERLLELAERIVLDKGFGATSIEELIAGVGITKSAFFYHFKDKNALAQALIERYLENDTVILDTLFARGDELSDDPLQGFLIGLKLFAEALGNLPEAHPGCLAASFCYQEQLFSPGVRGSARASRRSRPGIRRASRWISKHLPTWRRPSSMAGSRWASS